MGAKTRALAAAVWWTCGFSPPGEQVSGSGGFRGAESGFRSLSVRWSDYRSVGEPSSYRAPLGGPCAPPPPPLSSGSALCCIKLYTTFCSGSTGHPLFRELRCTDARVRSLKLGLLKLRLSFPGVGGLGEGTESSPFAGGELLGVGEEGVFT